MVFDDIITLDIECYYSDDYTLSKMTTEAYVRDPRWETILVSLKINAGKAFYLLPDRFEHFVHNEVDWSRTALLCHHAHFDGFALNYHYGVRPGFWIDTLSMARVIHGAKGGNSLGALLVKHGLREKGDYVTYAKGKHFADFSGGELQDYGNYSCRDSEGTFELAQILLPQLPEHELRLIDQTVRMFTEPVFVGDTAKLEAAVVSERQRKIELLRRINLLCPACNGLGTTRQLGFGPEPGQPMEALTATIDVACAKCGGLGVDKKPIGSNEQFANLLRKHGVEPETKISPTTGKPIYAFAKTDPAMQELLEDEDEEVRVLAEARIGVKSNIIETRAGRFLDCARRGPMPVYTVHAGAHTLRPSGGDGMNWLNMSNTNARRPEMAVLKQSIQAPPGHVIIEVDSSQGEARILAYAAGQQDLVVAFAQGRDVYSEHASQVYQRAVDRKHVKEDYIPGQVGKIGILSYGFGSGWYKSATELLKGALGAPPIQFGMEHMIAMHIDPAPFLNNPNKVRMVDQMPSRLEMNDRLLHCLVADALVSRYRAKMDKICGKGGFWKQCEDAITAMVDGREMVFGGPTGLFRTAKDRVYTPTGLWLDYRDIKRDQDSGDATYFDGRGRTKIYGSLFCENLVQHLHRLQVAEALLDIAGVGLKVALWTYDAVACVVPEREAELAMQYMIKAIARTPDWAPGLPLAAEGGMGKTLAEAKPK